MAAAKRILMILWLGLTTSLIAQEPARPILDKYCSGCHNARIKAGNLELDKADYAAIVSVIEHWWGGPSTALAHPVFFYELGELARVAEADGKMVGFLFGFPTGDCGYVHMVGIHPE